MAFLLYAVFFENLKNRLLNSLRPTVVTIRVWVSSIGRGNMVCAGLVSPCSVRVCCPQASRATLPWTSTTMPRCAGLVSAFPVTVCICIMVQAVAMAVRRAVCGSTDSITCVAPIPSLWARWVPVLVRPTTGSIPCSSSICSSWPISLPTTAWIW